MFIGIGFDRIIDNRTLKLITESSSDTSPKTDKDLDSSLRGNCFFVVRYYLAYLRIFKVGLFMAVIFYNAIIII